MSFVSQVNPDVQPACYELKIEATRAKDGSTVKVEGKYPVAGLFDSAGYCHFHKVHGNVIDDIFQKLEKHC